MIGIIVEMFCCNLFWDNSYILWWILVILENIFCILGVVGENIDFANFILLEGCLGGIGVTLYWLLLFDMLVLFVESILLLLMESELKRLVYRDVLYNLDCFFVICRVGARFGNFFGCFFYWQEAFLLERDRSENCNRLFCCDDSTGIV